MAIGPFTQSGAPVPAATGQAVSQVLGVEGPDIDNLQAAVFVIKPPGITQRYNLPAGETVLTLPILRTGILTSSNPGSTVVTLPRLNVDVVNGGTTYPKLNFTRPSNGSAELYFYLQRNGARACSSATACQGSTSSGTTSTSSTRRSTERP